MSSLLSTSRSTGTVLPFLSINGYVALTGCTPNVLTVVAIAAHKTADVIIFFIFSPLRAVTDFAAITQYIVLDTVCISSSLSAKESFVVYYIHRLF